MRRCLLGSFLLLACCHRACFSQTINWTGPNSGSYATAGNWSGGVVPNGGTITASITPGSATTVTLDASPLLRNLYVGAGHRLIGTDQAITLAGPTGTISNAGTIHVTGSMFPSQIGWNAVNDATFSGGGTTIVQRGFLFSGGGTLTNLNNTIRMIDAVLDSRFGPVVNSGTITSEDSSFGGTLRLQAVANALVNTGTVSLSSGTLLVSGSGGRSINNNGGTIQALAGTTFTLNGNLLINGGTLRTLGSGVFQPELGATLNNVTNLGFIRVPAAETITFTGSNTNSGSISLPDHSTPGTVRLAGGGGTTTLAGSGTIFMSAGTFGDANIGGTGTLVTSNFIIGRGNLGMGSIAIRSSGTIQPLSAANIAIKPSAGGFVNTGTLAITNEGSSIALDGSAGGAFDSAAGSIIVGAAPSSTTGLFNQNASSNLGNVALRGLLQYNNSAGTITAARITGTTDTGRIKIDGTSSLTLRAGGGTIGTSRITFLEMLATSRMDVTDHAMIIEAPGGTTFTFTGIHDLVKSGYAAGSWTGNGIRSSTAAGTAASLTKTAVGVAPVAQAIGAVPGTFEGQPVTSPTAILLLHTLSGDANLDRSVNIGDFSRLASNFNQPGFWHNGDFNYDGSINIGDFSLLASNFNKTLTSDLPRGSAVPEPLTALPLGILAALGSRSKRSRRAADRGK